jgi:uncharacterized protein YdaU (DUF1376 family)
MRRNWMPLYIPDFLADTMHLSAAETGAYLCLIMDYWMHDGLPDDDQKLASIARLPIKSWRQMRPTIEAFFREGWRHKRIDAELAKMVETMGRRHAAATRAGNASWMAREKKASTKRSANSSTDVQRHGNETSNETLNQRSTSDQPNVNHLTQESKITSTSVGTPRASENPTKSTTEIAESPAGFAEKAREAVQKNTSIASGELTASIRAKRWVKP